MNRHFVTITETTTHTFEVLLPDGNPFDQIGEARSLAQRRYDHGLEPDRTRKLMPKIRWEFSVGEATPEPTSLDYYIADGNG